MLLRFEGGYSNNPHDKGNYNSKGELVGSKLGISAQTYETFTGKVPTVEDIKNINEALFIEILRNNYWDKIKADLILSQPLANLICDWLYNSGNSAILHTQRVIGVKDDGIVGQKTIDAINASDPFLLFIRLHDDRITFVKNIVNNYPSQSVFLQGWLNRVNSITYTS